MMKNFATALMLAIGANAMDKPNVAGELHSKDAFKYGRFVARMQASDALGTGSAFYLFNLEDVEDFEGADVFDDWNAIAVVPSLENPIMTKMSEEQLQEEWEHVEDFTTNPYDYHTFEIEWTPGHLDYKIDGYTVRHKEGVDGLDREMNLVMSICAINDDEAGRGWDDTEAPYYTKVDYVEVYSYDIATAENFQLIFREDFDSFDPERWVKADDKTWEEMDSVFVEEYAYVEDGKLMLKLEKSSEFDDGDHGDGDHGDDHEERDFHVLPAPQDGTLDAAIEKATRVAVTMVKNQLNMFADHMAREYMHQ